MRTVDQNKHSFAAPLLLLASANRNRLKMLSTKKRQQKRGLL